MSATQTRAPLRNVNATVLRAEQKANSNNKPFVVARFRQANGTERTAMTYKADMMALLLASVDQTLSLFGVFDGNTFSPIGVSQPRQKAPAAEMAEAA